MMYQQTEEYQQKKVKSIRRWGKIFALIFFPLLISVLTRKKIERKKEDEFIKEVQEKMDEGEI